MNKISGIYEIVNKVNGKKYYGSSSNIKKRFSTHISELNKNKHPNHHLQYSWNKYGKDNFCFNIVEEIDVDNILIKEQQYLDCCKENPKLFYNMGYFVESPRKERSLSDETKEKLRQFNLGRKLSNETKQKISISLKGKFAGEKNPMYGKSFSKEHKEKISKSKNGEKNHNFGKHLSLEYKRKISESKKGKSVGKYNPFYG